MGELEDRKAGEKAARATKEWFTALGTLFSPVAVIFARYPKMSRGALVGFILLLFPSAAAVTMRYGGADWVLEEFSNHLISSMKVAVREAVSTEVKPLKSRIDSTENRVAALEKPAPKKRRIAKPPAPSDGVSAGPMHVNPHM